MQICEICGNYFCLFQGNCQMKIEKWSNKKFKRISTTFPPELLEDLKNVKEYKLVFEKIILGNKSLKYIRPVNFDTILDNYIEKYNDADYIPYWAEFWPSGQIMAREIFENYDFKNEGVLELGSGTGISGLSVPLKNGKIIYSDYDPNAFSFIRINHFLNNNNIPQILRIDLTNNNPIKKYNWLIASDLAYEKRLFVPLIETMKNFLAPNGKILLTEPERSFASPFFKLLEENGFQYNKKLLEANNNNKDITIGFYEIFTQKQG